KLRRKRGLGSALDHGRFDGRQPGRIRWSEIHSTPAWNAQPASGSTAGTATIITNLDKIDRCLNPPRGLAHSELAGRGKPVRPTSVAPATSQRQCYAFGNTANQN